MSWTIDYIDHQSRRLIAMTSGDRANALEQARRLKLQNAEIRRIKGPAGEIIDRPEILAYLNGTGSNGHSAEAPGAAGDRQKLGGKP